MKLPQGLDLGKTQNTWATILDPVANNPANLSIQLKDQILAIGSNVINHRLGRKMQGWIITDINGAASIYRTGIFNDLTLTLVSNAVVTVDLEVF